MTATTYALACLAVTVFCTLSAARSERRALAAAKLAQDAAGRAQVSEAHRLNLAARWAD